MRAYRPHGPSVSRPACVSPGAHACTCSPRSRSRRRRAVPTSDPRDAADQTCVRMYTRVQGFANGVPTASSGNPWDPTSPGGAPRADAPRSFNPIAVKVCTLAVRPPRVSPSLAARWIAWTDPRAGGRGRAQTKLCSRFMSGMCQYGASCSFAHGEADLKRGPSGFNPVRRALPPSTFLPRPSLNATCTCARLGSGALTARAQPDGLQGSTSTTAALGFGRFSRH